MTDAQKPGLIVVAGPNGSGKTDSQLNKETRKATAEFCSEILFRYRQRQQSSSQPC